MLAARRPTALSYARRGRKWHRSFPKQKLCHSGAREGMHIFSQIGAAILDHMMRVFPVKSARAPLPSEPLLPATKNQEAHIIMNDDDEGEEDSEDEGDEEDTFSRSSSFLALLVCDAQLRIESRHPAIAARALRPAVPSRIAPPPVSTVPPGTGGPGWVRCSASLRPYTLGLYGSGAKRTCLVAAPVHDRSRLLCLVRCLSFWEPRCPRCNDGVCGLRSL